MKKEYIEGKSASQPLLRSPFSIYILSAISLNREPRMAIITLKAKAHQKLLTANPLIRASVKRIIIALITSRNSPNVRTVMGIVRMTKIGLRTALNKARITATTKAAQKLATLTPGNR